MSVRELEAVGIVKRYGAVLANDHVDLSVDRGEIHAVMGENGAGKSTLMSILYGLHQPDEGTILLRGHQVTFRSPLGAIGAGMGMQNIINRYNLLTKEPVLVNNDNVHFTVSLPTLKQE